MDIQKEREAFERLPDINAILHNSEFGFNEGINQYYHPNHAEHRLSYAFLMGAWSAWQAAKAQAVPEWISVEDKLPAIGVYVMVFLEKQGHNPTNYNFCQYTKFGFHLSNVTHWMPLPDAPQEPAND